MSSIYQNNSPNSALDSLGFGIKAMRVCTVGGGSIEVIKKYIQDQKRQ
ncbi:MAG: hypothetical protein F6K56_27950 [Moorea sp. SIO3G5]|nr:hypothetical protein [Moorena sp. SIO3G5]